MKRVGLWLIVVAAVALSGCYLLTPAGGATGEQRDSGPIIPDRGPRRAGDGERDY